MHESTEIRLAWHLWIAAWLCTAIMGGIFGGLFLVCQAGAQPGAFAGGFGIGAYFAAFVGTIIMPGFGLVARLRRARGRRSLRLMTIAGGVTGLVSGLILGPFCILTCIFGAVGASLPGRMKLAAV